MKRSILILYIFFVGAGLAFSQSITITSPHTGDNWEKGRTYNITWTKTGSMDANVKIRLYNDTGRIKILDVVNSTPNIGIYNWAIPESIRTGNYIIRVKTLDNAVYDDGDTFMIRNSPAGTTYTAVTTIQTEIPPIRGNAELSIINVTRADSNHLRAGDPVALKVLVKNHSRWQANICIATPGEKSENFYHKGECGVINGGATRSYAITIPFKRTNLKNGYLKSTVFIVDANARGTLFKVSWKDSNTRDNFRSFSYPYELPDLVVVEIVRIRYFKAANSRDNWSEVEVKIKNQGNYASSPGKVGIREHVSWYYSGTCGPEPYLIFNMPGIAPGQTRTGILPAPCPLMFGPKPEEGKAIEIFVNAKSSIVESNFTNNKLKVNSNSVSMAEINKSKPTAFTATWR